MVFCDVYRHFGLLGNLEKVEAETIIETKTFESKFTFY